MEQTAVTLFEVEETLLALLDSEGTVTAEQEAEYRRDLAATLQTAIAKRDRVAGFIRHCDTLVAACKSEEARLAARRAVYQRAADRVRDYVQGAMNVLEVKELAGKLATFKICKNPDSVLILDEQKIPPEFKTLTITVSADKWEHLLKDGHIHGADLISIIEKTTVAISKAEIKKALAKGEVDGADLKIDSERLEVR